MRNSYSRYPFLTLIPPFIFLKTWPSLAPFPPSSSFLPVQYKTALRSDELRSWHRPTNQFPINTPILFSKLKHKKKKSKSRHKNAADYFKTVRDLTLKDGTHFALLEYSEQYPYLLSNVGMSTLVNNYYRKKDSKDEFVPGVRS